jgi:hypothetical protein
MFIFRSFIPFVDGTYDLFVHGQTFCGDFIVSKTDPGLGRAAFIWQTVNLQNIENELWFYFSSGKVREGHRYTFEILSHSGIILTAKESQNILNNNSPPPPNQALKLTE